MRGLSPVQLPYSLTLSHMVASQHCWCTHCFVFVSKSSSQACPSPQHGNQIITCWHYGTTHGILLTMSPAAHLLLLTQPCELLRDGPVTSWGSPHRPQSALRLLVQPAASLATCLDAAAVTE